MAAVNVAPMLSPYADVVAILAPEQGNDLKVSGLLAVLNDPDPKPAMLRV